MPYSRTRLTPNSIWRHRKGGLYIVLGISTCSTNGQEGKESVIYWSVKYQGLRDRAIGEFLDGRFGLLDSASNTQPEDLP